MTTIEARIANLSPAKRALLEQQLQAKGTLRTAAQAIPRRRPEQPVPLSFSQQRIWFLHQLYPDSTAYNQTGVYRLTGPLHLVALQQSLDELLCRHEVLRTTYTTLQNEPIQVINPAQSLAMPLIDLSHLPGSEWDDKIQQLAYEENHRLFDLSNDLMRRVKLLRFGEEIHVLLLTSHHIASDGWSNSVFWRELAALYGAFAQGQPSPLPVLPLQYADYALWQRNTFPPDNPSARGETLLRYWQTQLAQAPTLLNLPLDFPRPAEQKALGKTWHFSLSTPLVAALKILARQEEATLFMLLLAAFQVLLMRYSQQTDIVVGTPIANRQRPELEGLIGMFVNTLALRTDLAGNPPFRALLGRVRRVALGAYEHQDLPFEKLVEVLQPQRSLSHHPLVQVAFALQNMPKAEMHLSGVQVTRLPVGRETVKFDLFLALTESAEGLDGRLEYDTALFAPATIERMAGHFTTLLTGIVANPDCLIEQLPLLTAAERQQLLVDWNQTATGYPSDQCIHQLFEEQVTRTPEAVAVIFGDDQVCYHELNARANGLAHRLIELGVAPGVNVGICVECSVEMVVGLVAILKAGGVYVPLDVTYPAERLAFMLEDTGAPILLTQQRFAYLFINMQVTVVVLDKPGDEIANQPTTNPPCALTASAPAYIIYTSGSTGVPKGVTIPHRAINRLLFHTNYMDIQATDRIGQASNAAFDAATFEIWGALTHGATLVGIPREVSLVGQAFAAYLRQGAISVLFLTTALFNQIVRTAPHTFAPLRVLLFGGEAVDPTTVRMVLQQGAPAHLLHVYGPTESTTFSTWHPVESVPDEAQTVPIGGPLSNTQCYVLDHHLQPVPMGIAGELYIGGDGLALGYYRQPALTAEKFIANPFGKGRLYKTGDLVRYQANRNNDNPGALEFLGRIDQQVKIRGFRVEPAEIEAVLLQHPALQQAVVVAETEPSGVKRLIAYVVAKAASAPTTHELRQYLAYKLPAYMIPAAFVHLEQLPLTPNGKVDRTALPPPDASHSPALPVSIPARDALELQLTQIWEKVLRIRPIGVQDNFFDLGGHSLLAVQLLDRIASVTGKALPLSIFFQSPTIAQLATTLRQANWTPSWTSLAIVQPNGAKPPLFIAPPGGSSVLRFANITRHLPADQPIYGLEYFGVDHQSTTQAPHDGMEAMAAYYVQQMQKLQPEGPYLLAGLCFGAYLMFEIAQQLQAQGQNIALLAILDASPPANGPSWRYPKRFTIGHWQMVREYWQDYGWLKWVRSHLNHRINLLRRRFDSRRRRSAPAIVAHFHAQRTYHAQPYHGRLLLLQSEEIAQSPSKRARWESLAQGGMEYKMIPNCTHRTLLLQEPFTHILAQHLTDSLENVLTQSTQSCDLHPGQRVTMRNQPCS